MVVVAVVVVVPVILAGVLRLVMVVGRRGFPVPVAMHRAENVGQPDDRDADYQQGGGAGQRAPQTGESAGWAFGAWLSVGAPPQKDNQEQVDGQGDFYGQNPYVLCAVAAGGQVDDRHNRAGYRENGDRDGNHAPKLFADGPECAGLSVGGAEGRL